jgi:crossover junction endodeoxyribonuclease RuvC
LNCLTSFGYLFKIKLLLEKNAKIILGIDPGTQIMGYGIIEISSKQIRLLEMNVLKLAGIKNIFDRLHKIQIKVGQVIQEHKPDEFAIEAPFFGKNVQSMLKLGRAQGVAIATALSYGLTVNEYSPKKVKQSITGNGNADKEQIWKMLQHYISFTAKPKYYDATDAIAVALCHHFESKSLGSVSKKKLTWEDFIKTEAHRVRKK